MRYLIFAFVCAIATPNAEAGTLWTCVRALVPGPIRSPIDLAFGKRETHPYFRRMQRKLARSRERYRIEVRPARDVGEISIVTAIDIGPSLETTLRLNALTRRYPTRTFVAEDFRMMRTWEDGPNPSLVVHGPRRRVEVPYATYGETWRTVAGRLNEATALAATDGPHLIWAVTRPREGVWIEAKSFPARDATSRMDPGAFGGPP